ncbi:ABC transporter permease [Virgibacillus halophilus]
MRMKDQLRFILKNVRKNKVRTTMTILAAAIGCAFLIVLASVGFGLQKSIVADTLQDQTVTEIQVQSKMDKAGNADPLTMKNVSEIESLDGVKTVTRRNGLIQSPKYEMNGQQAEGSTIAVDFASEKKAGFKLSNGKMPEKENEVIVAYDFAKALVQSDKDGKNDAPKMDIKNLLGKKMEMDIVRIKDGKETHQTFSVDIVGVEAKPAKEWLQNQNVYISYAMMKKIDAYTGTYAAEPDAQNEDGETDHGFDVMKVYANSLESVQSVTDQLEKKDYMVYSVLKEMKQINVLFAIVKAGLVLVGTIAVIIASIGIYNTMTMAVTERAADIGIMKAIGANPRTIKRIFLLESCSIGLIGAVFGVAIAYVTSFVVNLGMPVIIEAAFHEKLPENLQFSAIPPVLILIAVVICIAVTIISGVRPAKHATKIDVLQAMRREL